jgi:hypothetical protein
MLYAFGIVNHAFKSHIVNVDLSLTIMWKKV